MLQNVRARFAAYAVVLALALAGGAVAGAAVGPIDTGDDPGHPTHSEGDDPATGAAPGAPSAPTTTAPGGHAGHTDTSGEG